MLGDSPELFEVPGTRLRELRAAEIELQRLRIALERIASSSNGGQWAVVVARNALKATKEEGA